MCHRIRPTVAVSADKETHPDKILQPGVQNLNYDQEKLVLVES
jgi:hypothetical protein